MYHSKRTCTEKDWAESLSIPFSSFTSRVESFTLLAPEANSFAAFSTRRRIFDFSSALKDVVVSPLEDEDDEDVYYDKVSVHVFEKEIESALNVKAIGNKKFAAKKFQEALKMYQSGLTKLEHVSPKCTTSDAVELVHVLFLNCAAAHIELKEYRKAVSCASKSLAYWPRVKAYYRRGTALLRMKRYEHAIRDFKAALKLRPNDSTVKRCLKEAQEKLK